MEQRRGGVWRRGVGFAFPTMQTHTAADLMDGLGEYHLLTDTPGWQPSPRAGDIQQGGLTKYRRMLAVAILS